MIGARPESVSQKCSCDKLKIYSKFTEEHTAWFKKKTEMWASVYDFYQNT